MANIVGRDLRSTTGRNMMFLQENSGLDPWKFSSARLKNALTKREIDHWREGVFEDIASPETAAPPSRS